MTIGKSYDQKKVKLEEQELEQVNEFVYLGSLFSEDGKLYSRCKTTYWIGISNEWEVRENPEVTQ